jgi:hypothetical protein
MHYFILFIVRWAIIFRHPRITFWYWTLDRNKRLPNPANPKTANDKFFWRKVFDRNKEFTEISDKLRVGNWLGRKGIHVDAAPVLWSGIDPENIPVHLLESGVIAKANHGSGTNIILRKAPDDREAFNRKMRQFLQKKQGYRRLEWGYFNIPRKLFIEVLIPNLVAEIKVFTFDDRIERIQILYDFESEKGISADVWLPNGCGGWERFPGSPKITRSANRPWPKVASEALKLAKDIGRHFDHMRVDFLSDGDKLWFGELTLYNLGGHIPLVGDCLNEGVNTSWDLRKSNFMRISHRGWRALYVNSLRKALSNNEPFCK